MSLRDFLQNRPSARANPESTPHARAMAVIEGAFEMVRRGRLVSYALDPARRERAEVLLAFGAGPDELGGDLQELWERLGTADLIPAAWVDGAPRFESRDALSAVMKLSHASLFWHSVNPESFPRLREGLWSLACAAPEAPTIEALWREAHARLAVLSPLPALAPPLWGWTNWSTNRTARPKSDAEVTFWMAEVLVRTALDDERRRRGQIPWTSFTARSFAECLAPLAREEKFPWPEDLPGERAQQFWPSLYDRSLTAAVAWELAVALDLRIPNHPGAARPERAGERFAQHANPYLPLAEILSRGYGWARRTDALRTADAPGHTLRVVLIAPRLYNWNESALRKREWWDGSTAPELENPWPR